MAVRANDNYKKFRVLTRKMMKLVKFMQKKFHNRFIAKATKAELIDDLWFMVLNDVKERAVQKQNDSGLRMLEVLE